MAILSITKKPHGSLDVNLSAVAGATEYKIYQSTVAGQMGVLRGTTNTLTFTDLRPNRAWKFIDYSTATFNGSGWANESDVNYFNGSAKKSANIGDYCEFTFQGTDIQFISRRIPFELNVASSYGKVKAKIYLDGVFKQSLELTTRGYSRGTDQGVTDVIPERVWGFGDLTNTTHIVKIEVENGIEGAVTVNGFYVNDQSIPWGTDVYYTVVPIINGVDGTPSEQVRVKLGIDYINALKEKAELFKAYVKSFSIGYVPKKINDTVITDYPNGVAVALAMFGKIFNDQEYFDLAYKEFEYAMTATEDFMAPNGDIIGKAIASDGADLQIFGGYKDIDNTGRNAFQAWILYKLTKNPQYLTWADKSVDAILANWANTAKTYNGRTYYLPSVYASVYIPNKVSAVAGGIIAVWSEPNSKHYRSVDLDSKFKDWLDYTFCRMMPSGAIPYSETDPCLDTGYMGFQLANILSSVNLWTDSNGNKKADATLLSNLDLAQEYLSSFNTEANPSDVLRYPDKYSQKPYMSFDSILASYQQGVSTKNHREILYSSGMTTPDGYWDGFNPTGVVNDSNGFPIIWFATTMYSFANRVPSSEWVGFNIPHLYFCNENAVSTVNGIELSWDYFEDGKTFEVKKLVNNTWQSLGTTVNKTFTDATGIGTDYYRIYVQGTNEYSTGFNTLNSIEPFNIPTPIIAQQNDILTSTIRYPLKPQFYYENQGYWIPFPPATEATPDSGEWQTSVDISVLPDSPSFKAVVDGIDSDITNYTVRPATTGATITTDGIFTGIEDGEYVIVVTDVETGISATTAIKVESIRSITISSPEPCNPFEMQTLQVTGLDKYSTPVSFTPNAEVIQGSGIVTTHLNSIDIIPTGLDRLVIRVFELIASGVFTDVSIEIVPFSVSVYPSNFAIKPGVEIPMRAEVRDRHYNIVDRPLKWSSSDKKVATVNEAGVVNGLKAGYVKIKAEVE